MKCNVDDLDWSDEDEKPAKVETTNANPDDDILFAEPQQKYPTAYEEVLVTQPDRLHDHKRSIFFSGNVKLKAKESSVMEDLAKLSIGQPLSPTKWTTRQNTMTSGLTFDGSPTRLHTRQNTSATGLSYDSNQVLSRTASFRSETSPNNLKQRLNDSNGLARQSTFGTAATASWSVGSTALPPAVLRFYGEDVVAEMWQILLSLQAVDTVSGLVKIISIRDLVKWLRTVNNREIQIVVDEKKLWKELNRWDVDDWVSFTELMQIIQRNSTTQANKTLLAPTASKNAASAKLNYQQQTKEAQASNKNFHKPIMLNRCCAHAACRAVCYYAYNNTTEGNLGHNGSTSIATADGIFQVDFMVPLFDKQKKRPKSSSNVNNNDNNDDVIIQQVLDTDNDESTQSDSNNGKEEEISKNSGEEEEEEEGFSRRDLFRINVAFSRVLVKRPGGRLRVEDILEIMTEAGLKYDLSKVAIESWNVAKHLLVESLDSVLPLMKRLQKNEDLIFGPLAHLIKYPVPLWLQQEFSQAEILLYQHHFMLIDIDEGGSIDADELQQLLNSFCGEGTPGGYQVSTQEAADIVAMFDLDGGGTLDFVEFLVLIYRLQRGTMSKDFLISPAGSLLVKALSEAKRQLHLFEEIEEVGLHPPKGCSIISFGGSPVLSVITIQVQPESTISEGPIPAFMSVPFFISVHVTMFDGYPYRAPDVLIKEPGIVHPLFIRALDGSCRLLHLSRLWQGLERLSEEERAELKLDLKDDIFVHNLESLLRHIYVILNQPSNLWTRARCIDWLPVELREIYQSWQWKYESLCVANDDNENAQSQKKTLYTMEQLTDAPTLKKFQKLPRLQQMHLGTLLIHLQDPMQYRVLASTVTQFKRVLER